MMRDEEDVLEEEEWSFTAAVFDGSKNPDTSTNPL
jgi:hypothetical protein